MQIEIEIPPTDDGRPLGSRVPADHRQSPGITFKGGLSEPFHRWFRLTPSYSPALVRDWVTAHPPVESAPLVDPFVGAGTSCIAASRLGYSSVGFEVNPFLAFVSRVSTEWGLEAATLRTASAEVLADAEQKLRIGPPDVEEFATFLGTRLPIIHNVLRWWRPDVLRQLLAVRECIRTSKDAAKGHLLLALAQVVYPSASITLGRLQIAFRDRTRDEIDAVDMWHRAVDCMIEDLETAVPERVGAATIHHSDGRLMNEVNDGEIGGLFCSPPYPNRYSYVWNTRPHLYLLEIIDSARAATDIDLATIGGTWGRATTDLERMVVEPRPNVARSLGLVLEQLDGVSLLMRNYVCKYFNDLDAHLSVARKKLTAGARAGYVVGNTETRKVMVETQAVLGELMSANGFDDVRVEPIRSRNSGQGLLEAIVSGQRV
jgi:hypothetical protein